MTQGTMELIQTVTVGSGGAANIEFTNIPQTYSDLKLVLSARTTAAVAYENIQLQFNNSGGTAYSDRIVFSNSQNALSASNTAQANTFFQYAVSSTATASTFSSVDFYIPNYAGSTNKSISVDSVAENNSSTTAFLGLAAELWANTAAITSIKLTPNTGGSTFVQHSTATLYGITRVPAGAKATGGVITDDASYWYHTFTSSGTFTPSQAISDVDFLVVAGGGGGGPADDASGTNGNRSGGGGAGGLRCTVGATGGGGVLESRLSLLANTNYTVTIGAGGSGTAASPTNGSDSIFHTITSTGGGVGGGLNSVPNWFVGGTGGSGGGGSEGAGLGNGTANQGYAGGAANGSQGAGGGGGGAGAVGQTAPDANTGGNGGNGVATTISGTSVTYAGGGGGSSPATQGAGGTGGGGSASKASTGTAGTTNTGGGGGSGSRNGGNGGSGIVIVRYAK